MKRRLIRGAFAVLGALVVVAGCGDGGTSADDGIAGTYSLRSVNGTPLPFETYEDAEVREDIVSGVVELRTSGRFTDRTVFHLEQPPGSAPAVDTLLIRGTYDVTDGVVTFTEEGTGEEYTMVRTGRALVQTGSLYGRSVAYRFEK
jgi:hypothetical protein